MRTNRRRKASGLEREIYSILHEEFIPFVREKTVGACHADIFIAPSTLIELNGCYWHGCTKCFPTPNKAQRLAIEKDSRRYYFFNKLGFDLELLWECELKADPVKVRKRLKAIYAKAKEK